MQVLWLTTAYDSNHDLIYLHINRQIEIYKQFMWQGKATHVNQSRLWTLNQSNRAPDTDKYSVLGGIMYTMTKWAPSSRRHLQMHFLKQNVWISIKIPLNFDPNGPMNNIPALAHIMAWRRPDDKPLYANQCWLEYWGVYPSFGLNELTHCGREDLWKWAIFTTILTSPKSWLSQEDLEAGYEYSLVPMDS